MSKNVGLSSLLFVGCLILFFFLFLSFVSADLTCGVFRSDFCSDSLLDYVRIFNCDDLQNVSYDLSGNYVLMNNIDCYDTVNWVGGGFEPIGTSLEAFTGVFDGQGFNVSGLFINRPSSSEQGLFGFVDGGIIRNVGLINVNITGDDNVGGLVGWNDGSVSKSFVIGSVIGSSDVGGLVGQNEDSIFDSYSRASISSTTNVGGLVGHNNGGQISRSYSSGLVSGSTNTGGLVGSNSGSVSNSFYDNQTSGQSDTGKGSPRITADMRNFDTFDGANWDIALIGNYDGDSWIISNGLDYPRLGYELLVASSVSDYVLFKLRNYTGGFDNSHAQMRSFSPHYSYGVCCSSPNQVFSYDCSLSNAVEFLRMNNESNSHVQVPVDFQGLVSYWKFNDDFTDFVGGFHATNNGASWTSDRRGNSNSALSFNGVGNYLGTDLDLSDISKGLSVSAWIQISTIDGSRRRIISQGTGAQFIRTEENSNRIYPYLRDSNDNIIASAIMSTSVLVDEWVHVVLTIDEDYSGFVRLYINGSLNRETSNILNSSLITSGGLRIGGDSTFFHGLVDEVIIFDRALNATEVSQLYSDGLVGHWRFNGDFLDYSGSGVHGTNSGASWVNNRFGAENSALFLDGSSYVYLAGSSASYSSFSAWIKSSSSAEQVIAAGVFDNFCVLMQNGRIVKSSSGGGESLQTVNTFNDDTWRHLVVVKTGLSYPDSYKIFVDGVEQELQSSSNARAAGRLIIGARFYSSTYSIFFNGLIDDVRMFNRALSEFEIGSLFVDDLRKYDYSVCVAGNGDGECFGSYGACSENYTCIGSVASSEGWDFTNAHFGSCDYYDLNICCSVSSPPGVPELIYPVNNDSLFVDRSPGFEWSDVDTAVEYQIVLAEDPDFISLVFDETVIDSNYSYSGILDFGSYYWRVRAFNGVLFGVWSEVFNFTLVTNVMIDLATASVDFGGLSVNESANTSSNTPPPFRFLNIGNIEADLVNVSVDESLWDSVEAGLGTDYWLIRARSSGSFNYEASIIDWVNVSSVIDYLIKGLNFTGNNEVLVDVAVRVPVSEGPGDKSSNMSFFWGVAS
ncbi:LamG domain-containing protein [Candidatus Woesearchaeota archaeon]|nr:LamG domain-containing protein [Candidatus Woesearchaeota archaeon]